MHAERGKLLCRTAACRSLVPQSPENGNGNEARTSMGSAGCWVLGADVWCCVGAGAGTVRYGAVRCGVVEDLDLEAIDGCKWLVRRRVQVDPQRPAAARDRPGQGSEGRNAQARARVYTRLLAEGMVVVVVGAGECVRAVSKTQGEGDGGRKCLVR